MLSLFKRKQKVAGVTSVVFTEAGVAFAHIKGPQTQQELLYSEFVPSADPLVEPRRFKEIVDANALDSTLATIVLPEHCYQIHLVEKPEVPDQELAEALRWRIKDLVSFDVEQAYIDYVELADDAYRGRSKMVYAVAAMQDKVDRLVEWCDEIGLIPAVVDVPELALLNLTEDLADTEAGLAVFSVGKRNSSINLLSDSSLYFTRQLSYNRDSSPEMAGAAVLELQRSLDYYESQVGKPPCVRLLVMPLQADDAPLMNELRYNLALDIHSLDLNNLVASQIQIDQHLQQDVTLAVAAALRSDVSLKEVKG